jgi:hypothetical protein
LQGSAPVDNETTRQPDAERAKAANHGITIDVTTIRNYTSNNKLSRATPLGHISCFIAFGRPHTGQLLEIGLDELPHVDHMKPSTTPP